MNHIQCVVLESGVFSNYSEKFQIFPSKWRCFPLPSQPYDSKCTVLYLNLCHLQVLTQALVQKSSNPPVHLMLRRQRSQPPNSVDSVGKVTTVASSIRVIECHMQTVFKRGSQVDVKKMVDAIEV